MQRVLHSLRQSGRFQRNARLYLLSNALSGVTTGIFLVLYTLYLTALGYNANFVGATLFAGTIGAGITIFPAGICVDRWSGKQLLIGASLLIGLVGSGAILLREPGPLLICAFLTGVAAAFILVINAPFLTRHSLPSQRPDLFSLNIVLTQITTVLGEVIGGMLPAWFAHNSWLMAPLPDRLNWLLAPQTEARSYQYALLVAGLIALPSFLPLFLLDEDRPAAAPAPPTRLPWRLWPATAGTWLRPRRLSALVTSSFFALVLVQTLTGLGAGLIIPYFNLFFVRHLHASPALFGLIDGAANGLTALTTLCAPWLAHRLGHVGSIAWTRLCSLPLLLVVGLTGSLRLAASLYPLREGLMDMSNGILLVFSMESVVEEYRGIANSAYQAAFQVAWALTSSLGGLLIVSAGYGPLFVGAALCYLTTIIILWGRFGQSRKRQIQQTADKSSAGLADETPAAR